MGGSDYLIFLQSTEAKYKLFEFSDYLIPKDAKDLINRMIKIEYSERPSIE
jgi:hypothetical protein